MNAKQAVIENQNIITNMISDCQEMATRLNISVEEAISRKVAAYVKYAKSETEIAAWKIREEEAMKIISTDKITKDEVIELQEKANQLLQMAQDMDKRIELIKGWLQEPCLPKWYVERRENDLDCCQRGSRRLWSAYLQVLTQIKLEL